MRFLDSAQLKALQTCCKDEAAFSQLQQILGDGVLSNIFQSQSLLEGMVQATQQLLRSSNCPAEIQSALTTLAQATQADGVSLLVAHPPGFREQFCWHRHPESLAQSLNCLDLPILIRQVPWGKIQVTRDRPWLEAEIATWTAIATIIGGLILREQTEQDLRLSEERLESFFWATSEAVIIHRSGLVLDVNQAAEALFRSSASDLIGQSVLELTAPASRPLVKERLQSPLDGETLELVGQRRDGTSFNAEIIGKGILYCGEPARVVGIRDISTRKAAELALWESQKHLRQQNQVLMALAKRKALPAKTLDQALHEITEAAAQTLEVDRVGVWLYTADRSGIRCIDLYIAGSGHHEQGAELKAIDNPAYFQALEGERTIAVPAAQTDSRTQDFTHSYLEPLNIQALLDAPIWLRGQMVGVLCHEQVGTPRIWTPEAENFAGSMADLISLALEAHERQQAEQALQDTLKRDRLLGEMALRIRQSLDFKEILTRTVMEVREFLQVDRVLITQFDEHGRTQVVVESVDAQWPSVVGWISDTTAYPLCKSLLDAKSRESYFVVNDTETDAYPPFLVGLYRQAQIRASIAVPIVPGEQFFGLLVAHQCSAPRQWKSQTLDFLQQLATQVAIAIQQAELYAQVQALNTNLERQVAERTAELQQKMEELEALSRLKEDFLHMVSHDLRTPVVGVLLVLKNFLHSPEEAIAVPRAVLERILNSGERQLQLINSLLEAHANEAGNIVLHLEMIQLQVLVSSVIEDLAPLIQQHQAQVTNQIATTDLPPLQADPNQLRRVFENLLTNALKHNQPGLQMTLSAAIEVESDMNYVRCWVADNGVGMSQFEGDRLFERYSRGSATRPHTGFGLGLYLCRQVITAHGGDIGVVSAVGQGAKFWFRLPISPTLEVFTAVS